MNRHQVLTGAVNAGDHCYAIGSVEGVPFTAYAAGCDVVILGSNFDRVQIIPGVCHGNIQIGCLDCSTDSGKIAAAYGYQVCIFEPTPLTRQTSTHKLDYRWVQTCSFKADCFVRNLSWNLEGTRLLTGGTFIQLWQYNNMRDIIEENEFESEVHFHVNGEGGRDEKDAQWSCIWQCKTAHPVAYLKFSQDGTLFASAGKLDRLVKIWYETKAVNFPAKSIDTQSSFCTDEVNFTFIYIAHPRTVTGLSWRKTSKYMPRGSVANMLVTSCKDNICRVWVQTILPDDGLVNMQQFDPLAAQNPKFRTHRQKHKFMMRLKHIKTCFHFRRRQATHHQHNGQANTPIPTLPSTFSSHDFHSFGVHGSGITPGFHFHLATSINAETDIPLVPSISASGDIQEPNFVLHWLNNKEMHFTLHAEQILQDLSKRALEQETQQAEAEDIDVSEGIDVLADEEAEETVAEQRHLKSDKKKLRQLRGFKAAKFNKSKSVDEPDEPQQPPANSSYSLSSTNSTFSLNVDPSMAATSPIGDALDRKIEALLWDWHGSPDLLFSIHPVDGSFLVWLVDWLDEYIPGSFRQAQVSFSSRIPNALPLGDAMTMSTNLALYNCQTYLDLKSVLKLGDVMKSTCGKDFGTAPNTPVICMLSKHKNGSLNLWNITFSDNSKFTQVLSVGHISRVCGHRFRVNDISCHPVLPLLLSTSHHNVQRNVAANNHVGGDDGEMRKSESIEDVISVGFCSELILWRVDPVGPLCRSGGVTELARINSPEVSAFSNVAWIPTLLPSTTLGSLSNSPSACFVASDGCSLRIYQAVIDARNLLAEIFTAERRRKRQNASVSSLSSSSSYEMGSKRPVLQDAFKIVSQQSTARPGCIIQLDAIAEADHDWHNTQFLHVFQEQLITGEKNEGSVPASSGLMESILGAMVDLQQSTAFEEPFYLVVLAKDANNGDTILHMWRIVIASHPTSSENIKDVTYAPDSHLVQDSDHSNPPSRGNTPVPNTQQQQQNQQSGSHPLSISTTKVCTQRLPLPANVEIIHASPAAGHLSSSSIYPACFAPYLITTACSDSKVRFWYCRYKKNGAVKFTWAEWEMLNTMDESNIEIPGVPLNVSCAYSGRFACAYKSGRSFTRPLSENPNGRFVNLCVAIYECESTGGSEWILEDTIHLKNISLPEVKLDLDLSYVYDKSLLEKKQQSLDTLVRSLSHEDILAQCDDYCYPNLKGLVAVPSFSTLQTLRKAISEKGNQCILTQKHLVQLDWVSTEDGSHVLTVGVGSKILLFTTVSSDLAQANIKAMSESKASSRPPVLTKASSMMVPHFNPEEIRWMKLRSVELNSADGLPPLPMQISWVRDGILVVGMDNEMHIYCQWRDSAAVDDDSRVNEKQRDVKSDFETSIDSRNLTDKDIITIAQDGAQARLPALAVADTKKKRELNSKRVSNDTSTAQSFMPDYGLFEASRMACPVLPQYHPKQLMELLNFGKIRRVKAILMHLVRCLSGAEARTAARRSESSVSSARQRAWSRSRTLSISIPQGSSPMDAQTQSAIMSEELHLDYVEINAIPPLPLYTLLAADKETVTATTKQDQSKDYGSLFSSDLTFDNDDDIENILAEEDDAATPLDRRRSVSAERQGLTNFGTRQARTLTRLLTHTHLPGLSSLDQMHLLALADTVASCNTAFADRFQIDAIKPDGTSSSSSPESLDDCGLRFLLAMRHHLYLMRCLPPQQRITLHKQGLNPATLVWAFHSESDEELLNVIPGMQKNVPKWAELKELGAGWWIRNNAVLKRCIEKIAKAAFQARSDPLDAALWYLAMKKKSLVWGLFRSVKDDKMTSFFQNNFAENRWRKAALKNAFILLGKQRFTHAAAFFLLAGSLWDAVEVCLNKLNDLQLAMVIVRLHEGDLDATPPGLKKLLYEEILGYDKDGNCDELSHAHPDPFLRSMTYWILKDYANALSTLLLTDVGGEYSKFSEDEAKLEDSGSRNAFNFYVYLRTHPLLIRQHIADSAQGKQTVLLTGFPGSTSKKKISIRNKQVFFEDAITPLERRLYFMTAHAHFKAGCPALALEVLSKLPSKVIDAFDRQSTVSNSPARSATPSSAHRIISTGTINENGTDWGKTTKKQEDLFDWSQSSFNPLLNDEPLKMEFSDDENNDGVENDTEPSLEGSPNPSFTQDEPAKLDIMAQQLKFIACLKIVMEEMSTLATGFEVDGGQLRYQLYIWLEREVEALKELCNYSGACPETRSKSAPSMSGANPEEADKNHPAAAASKESSEKPTLHEILLADKMDFEAKLERAEKRKRWLKANETLLRTLLSYCSLHGASGGGLASVRMELILLLQELQQEKTQQQLLSPLPFPTTLPLLSASVACHKTVITDPIRHLQAMAHDILCCIIDLPSPGIPGCVSYSKVFVLRDLSTALSACIYQSLCDSDSFSVKHNGYLSAGMEALASTSVVYQESHLMAGCGKRRRLSSSDEPLQPSTPPNKWPGVTSLRALLAQEKDDDTPKLSVLLCEAFISVYMSLLIQALSSAESHTLYRLMGQIFDEQTWSALFGGGMKKLLKVAVGSSGAASSASQPAANESSHSEAGLLDTLVKQRMKLHMKILGQFGQGSQPPVIKEDRPTYREQFVPPEMSMASYFMTKPTLGDECANIDYDSNDSLPSEEELEEELSDDDDYLALKDRQPRVEESCSEHSDPNSYSWGIMRYAVVRLAQHHVQKFLNIAGLELQEMPVASPLIHSILKIFDQWLNVLKGHMESYGCPPQDYIPTCYVETGTTGPAIQKYRSILEPQNTPFKSRQNSVYPVRRLWCYLVRQEHVQDIFVRYIFGKKKILSLVDDSNSGDADSEPTAPDPIKIIHKDQDSISAFCINMANNGIIALATTKEVQELDISVLLEPPLWLEDNCEYDILNLNRSPESLPSSEYLVVQTAADRPLLAQIAPTSVGGQVSPFPASSTVVNMPSTFTTQTGRSTTVLMKHKVDGVRRMNSHPVLPLYLTGCQDGSVRIWEWGHNQPVALPRAPGTYAKVTRVMFNPQGNKFGISDGDGNLSLWQVGLSSNANKMFFSHQCHGKQTSDFVFVGSSSLIATAGHSSESKNVCLWDTLLPQKKSMVQAFICHDQGCSCLVYAPQHQTIISGGKKGEIFILDVRQKQVRHRFSGHDSPIKCIALDPNEEFFVTGSADGDIKVWGLSYHNAFFTFPGEHMRNTFFRNISVGVSQLYVDTANRLFSCGADGSMKLRQLPERELAVHSIY